jgi:hypothetical protein
MVDCLGRSVHGVIIIERGEYVVLKVSAISEDLKDLKLSQY